MRGTVLRVRPVLAAGVCFGLILALAGLGQATKAVQTAARGARHPIYSVGTERKAVSLGVNCAWGNEDIPVLIKILSDAGVKATFFVVGDWCDKYPESVRQLFDAGHELGTHSDTHADMTTLDRDGVLRELRDSADKLERVTGERPTLFRPPSGAYDNEVIATAEEAGFTPIQWDCERVHIETTNQDFLIVKRFFPDITGTL